jgi:hypothetical protein
MRNALKVLLPIAFAAVGALVPLLARGAEDDYKGAYGDASASGSTSAGPGVSVSGSASVGPVSVAASASVSMPKTAASASAATKGKKKGPEVEEDPLVVPEGLRDNIGSSYAQEDRPVSSFRVKSGLWPVEGSQRIGNETTTTYFPFYFDRKLTNDEGALEERQSFYTLYYRKRSKENDVDAIFPFLFHWRDESTDDKGHVFETKTWVVPPFLWRDGPGGYVKDKSGNLVYVGEWHRWFAPLFFASSQADGGYFHAPLLLTFSHHNPDRAFSLIGGLGFYDRTGTDVDYGVFPFYFGGHDSAKMTSWWMIPPLLTYHHEDRDFETSSWVFGPVYTYGSPEKSIFDVLPLFLHNHGVDAHGQDYNSTTLLPLFHVSKHEDKRLLVTPLFLRASDKDGVTWVTPLYSQYRGRTTLDLAGPLVPLFAHYVDADIYKESWLFGPFYTTHDPTGYTTMFTPLIGQSREYGVSNTTWVIPFLHETRVDGWTFNMYPLLWLGKDGDSFHDVLAPVWWDFVSPKRRTTIAFPVFWRFRDEEGLTQLALNTLYEERKTSKGNDFDFYFLPFVHVGEKPDGNAWDVLFGLVGYKREGTYKQLKLFWIPIDLTASPSNGPATPIKKHKTDLKQGF